MSSKNVPVLATAPLAPGQSTVIPTNTGVNQTLTLSNTSTVNVCSWSVTGFPALSPSTGTLQVSQLQVFPATNYGGAVLTVSNTTSPTSAASLQVLLQ